MVGSEWALEPVESGWRVVDIFIDLAHSVFKESERVQRKRCNNRNIFVTLKPGIKLNKDHHGGYDIALEDKGTMITL